MNTTPINAGNLSDFLEKTEHMTHFLLQTFFYMVDTRRHPTLTTVPLSGSARSAGLTDTPQAPQVLAKNDGPLMFIPRSTA